jgi:hypothetical protein
MGEDVIIFPPWVEICTEISHFLMTFNCSVNFFIYLVSFFDNSDELFFEKELWQPSKQIVLTQQALPQIQAQVQTHYFACAFFLGCSKNGFNGSWIVFELNI